MRIWLSAPFPSVIHRSGSVTEVKLRLQGARQIQFCTIDGFRQCLAKRQMRCDRRRQRASGAMRVRIIDTTRAEPSDFAARFNEHIAGILRAMTAFDEHRAAEMAGEHMACRHHVVLTGDAFAILVVDRVGTLFDGQLAQRLGLRHIRRDDGGHFRRQ